jgi:hypothetical protein
MQNDEAWILFAGAAFATPLPGKAQSGYPNMLCCGVPNVA